jgi:hypothetical protein
MPKPTWQIFLLIFVAVIGSFCLLFVLGSLAFVGYDVYVSMHELDPIPCDEQLPLEEVEVLVAEHQDEFDEIQSILESFGGFAVEPQNCGGEEKANMYAIYGGQRQQKAIYEITGDKTFFGVPIRWQNV